MDYRIHIAKKAILARIPFSGSLRRAKRNLLGYAPDQGNLQSTIAQYQQMRAELNQVRRSFAGSTVLEIGSGWFPTIPILLCADGAYRVLMSDHEPHLDASTSATTLRFLKGILPENRAIQAIQSVRDLPLDYLAPLDPSALPDGSLDYVVSRTVLEHIPPDVLTHLLKALRPKLAPTGMMLHLVDHSDHLEHVDRSISKVNFLTWSCQKHAAVNWLIRDGENRLRHHDYLSMFRNCGYEIVAVRGEVHEPTRLAVQSMKLASPYSNMTPEQLATLTSLYMLA